jgi:hypothetical protein
MIAFYSEQQSSVRSQILKRSGQEELGTLLDRKISSSLTTTASPSGIHQRGRLDDYLKGNAVGQHVLELTGAQALIFILLLLALALLGRRGTG